MFVSKPIVSAALLLFVVPAFLAAPADHVEKVKLAQAKQQASQAVRTAKANVDAKNALVKAKETHLNAMVKLEDHYTNLAKEAEEAVTDAKAALEQLEADFANMKALDQGKPTYKTEIARTRANIAVKQSQLKAKETHFNAVQKSQDLYEELAATARKQFNEAQKAAEEANTDLAEKEIALNEAEAKFEIVDAGKKLQRAAKKAVTVVEQKLAQDPPQVETVEQVVVVTQPTIETTPLTVYAKAQEIYKDLAAKAETQVNEAQKAAEDASKDLLRKETTLNEIEAKIAVLDAEDKLQKAAKEAAAVVQEEIAARDVLQAQTVVPVVVATPQTVDAVVIRGVDNQTLVQNATIVV